MPKIIFIFGITLRYSFTLRMNTEFIKRENIIGSRRVENYVWIILLVIGGVGFLLASGSSYFKINLLPFGVDQ